MILLAADLPPEIIPNLLIGMHHAQQFALFMIGISLVTIGMMGEFSLPRNIFSRENRVVWLIMLLALLIRLPNLGSVVHAYIDEMHFAEAVIRLWNQPDVSILSSLNPIAAFSYVYPYLQTYSMSLFGNDLFGLRMVSVLLGTGMIPAIYILGSRLFDRRVGLIAAILLAGFPPHIHFSRLALNNIADPFFGVWSIALLLIAMQSNEIRISRKYAALAGFCLGMTQYFYEGGRIVFPVLILVWLLILLLRKSSDVSLSRADFLRFIITAALIALPVIGMMLLWHSPLTPRLQDQAVEGEFWRELLLGDNAGEQITLYFNDHLLPALGHLFWRADSSAYYYGGETALLLPILLPFFVAGFVVMFKRWRAAVLLLLWIMLVVIGNSLLQDNDWTARFVPIFVPLVLICALGVDVAINWIMKFFGGAHLTQVKWVYTVSGLLLIQVAYYYGIHLPLYNQQIRPDLDYVDTAYRAADLPADTHAYLLTGRTIFINHLDAVMQLRDASVSLEWIHPYDFPYQQVHRLPKDQVYAFFVAPDDLATHRNLQRVFGTALTLAPPSPYNIPIDKQYDLYIVGMDSP